MSTRDKRYDDDFANLDPAEAKELAEVADLLRADRHEPEDEKFWASLQQRIVNEVEVTPLPKAAEAGRSGKRKRSLFGWFYRPFLATVGAAAVVAVALWGLGRYSDEPLDEAPDAPIASHDDTTETGPLVVPDELWSDGFLAHKANDLYDDEYVYEDEYAYDDEYAYYDDEYETNDDYIFSYELDSPWGLGDLSEDELLALESILEG